MRTVQSEFIALLNRVFKTNHTEFPQKLKYFFDFLKSNSITKEIISQSIINFPFSDQELSTLMNQRERDNLIFENEEHQCSFAYQFVEYFVKKNESYNLPNYKITRGQDVTSRTNQIIASFLRPIEYYVLDEIGESNYILNLLIKYKKRTQWFTYEELKEKYDKASSQYEKILEDGLRLFLFDQGIKYPFSTPLSNSGRADIISNLEKKDPLVCEIKIVDRQKKYGKNRIISGFSQIVKYSNDYNKNIGYLVIFNFDPIEINFEFSENNKIAPSLEYNGKLYHFITIQMNQDESASKIGKWKEIKLTKEELINEVI